MSPPGGGDPERRIPADDTVRRPPASDPEYLRGLLRHLQQHQWPGAPRLLGVDEYGYDVFARYPGRTASSPYQPPAVWSDASLARVARLLRQLHDLTVGTVWADDTEVACHNDVTPANTVYREIDDGLRPCGFVNWEFAGPGRRVHDLAYACWRFLDLGPARSEPTGPARLMRLMCDSYELGRTDRGELVQTVLAWQQRILTEERARIGLAETIDGSDRTEQSDRPEFDAPDLLDRSGKPGRPAGSKMGQSETGQHGERRESIADIQAAIDWVRQYGDILDAVVTARNPPETTAPPDSTAPPGTMPSDATPSGEEDPPEAR